MFRLWGKILIGERIVKQTVYQSDDKLIYTQFFRYLTEICEGLDIATPILLKTHIFNFAKFGTVRFLPRDFAETPEFDKLIVEQIKEK